MPQFHPLTFSRATSIADPSSQPQARQPFPSLRHVLFIRFELRWGGHVTGPYGDTPLLTVSASRLSNYGASFPRRLLSAGGFLKPFSIFAQYFIPMSVIAQSYQMNFSLPAFDRAFVCGE